VAALCYAIEAGASSFPVGRTVTSRVLGPKEELRVPGAVPGGIPIDHEGGLVVQTGMGQVRIRDLRIEPGRRMVLDHWVDRIGFPNRIVFGPRS